MGYNIYGTVKVTFADADHLAGYLNTERPTTPLRTGSDGKALASEFKDFWRDYFEYNDFLTSQDMLRPVDPSDPTVRFDIRISGRSTSTDDFLDTSIAQWASPSGGSARTRSHSPTPGDRGGDSEESDSASSMYSLSRESWATKCAQLRRDRERTR